MKFNSAFISSLLIFSISQIAICADAWAEKQEKPERWFEIEVILFKQLSNKALLKEQFFDHVTSSNLPNYQQSFDILTPYLQPSLTRIKQFVPLCGEKNEQHRYLESLQQVNSPFPEQMQLIEQVAMFNMPDFSEALYASEEDEYVEKAIQEDVYEDIDDDKTASFEVTQVLISNNNEIIEEATFEEPEVIEDTSSIFDLQKEELAKPIFSTQNICVISQNEFENLFNEEQLTGFDIDSFGVDLLPTKLNAAGSHNGDSPYLIADQSLLLKDINQRLRWSKEFKPLLHFGWRQVGITKKKSIPLKLFAGEHLAYEYQQALSDYQREVEEEKAIEQNLLEQLTQAQNFTQIAEQNIATLDDKKSVLAQQNQQALNELFAHIEHLNNGPLDKNTINATLNNIDTQSLEDILSTTNTNNQELAINPPPNEPLQSWFLDGFFKVHLDRFLYITADFNVLNQNQVKTPNQGDENKDVKLINFSQNKRVISGEIHYFDHPYIGMIVQIRRFDPTKPADEAVTQAIK